MPVTMPRAVREFFGGEVAAAFQSWMKEEVRQTIEEKGVPRDEYREVLSRLDRLEKDVSLIKEELIRTRTEVREDRAQMRAEFGEQQAQLRAEFREGQAQMRAEFHEDLGELRREMHERFDQMHYQMIGQTRWFIGALTVLVTVISALLAIAQFTP